MSSRFELYLDGEKAIEAEFELPRYSRLNMEGKSKAREKYIGIKLEEFKFRCMEVLLRTRLPYEIFIVYAP